MERRTFLTGAVAAVTMPVSALANLASAPANSSAAASIVTLVEEHKSAKMAARAASEIEDAIYKQLGRPERAFVTDKEFRFWHRPLKEKELFSLTEIDDVIDRYEKQRTWNYRLATTAPVGEPAFRPNQKHAESYSKAMRESAEERAALHALFSERNAAFEAWDIVSGHREAEAASEAAWDRVTELDDQILAFPCVTLDDARAKARHMADEYGCSLSQAFAVRFIAEVAAIGGSVA